MTEDNQNVLYMRMLGGLHITWQGKPILLGKNISTKMVQLLLIVVYFRSEGIRREKLLEQLYADSDIEQASNSLRAIVFRLRRSLEAAGLPKEDYISTKGGIYRWQSQNIKLHLDVEEFHRQAEDAFEEQNITRKTQLLESACRAYTGEFLPMMIADNWVAAANWKYQEIYFKCLRELTEILREQGRFGELLGYCEMALKRYPYEEWQLVKLDCLTAMQEYNKALHYYEQVIMNYHWEFGIMPSDAMKQRYQIIKNRIQFQMNHIEEIRSYLQQDKDTIGPAGCDYLTFSEIYRFLYWVLERNEIKASLVLFTIVDKDGVPLENSEQLEICCQLLKNAIVRSIRRSDLYSQCGKNQFLVLTTGADEHGCKIAVQRIQRSFYDMKTRGKNELHFTFCAVENSREIK